MAKSWKYRYAGNMIIKNYKNLTGKVLVATPYAMKGNIFYKSLIYVAHHNEEGAIGLIVNHSVASNPSLLSRALIAKKDVDLVHLGGPLEPERGFFLHTNDYNQNILFESQEAGIAVSSNQEIMTNIQNNQGPKQHLFIAGYTGWVANQLEEEMVDNLWLASEPDHEIIFNKNDDYKWTKSFYNLGFSAFDFSQDYSKC